MTKSSLLLTAILSLLLTLVSVEARRTDFASLQSEAERYYAEGSYSRARELYLGADLAHLGEPEKRWVKLRLADCLWRAEAATRTADTSVFDRARAELHALIADNASNEPPDLVWSEANESLGDFWWVRPESRNWGEAWRHYSQALDWWAGSDDLQTATRRYLSIIWKVSMPPASETYYHYGYYGNLLPIGILDNALKIAESQNDRARLHYLIAMTIRGGGSAEQRQRVSEQFEAALEAGRGTDWYDDALYHYAEWLSTYGRVVTGEDGQWRQEPDFAGALALYRRLTTEFERGETRYWDRATQQIDALTSPALSLAVSNTFLPSSEIRFHAAWRNVRRIQFALYRVDLTRDLRFKDHEGSSSWVQNVPLTNAARVKSWGRDTGDSGEHKPGQEAIRFEDPLPTGAFIIEATAGSVSARELILVTDASIVLKTSRRRAIAYLCNALDGSPMPNARVVLRERLYGSGKWVWQERQQGTDENGLAVFDLDGTTSSGELLVTAESDGRQAFTTGYASRSSRDEQSWRLYAFTDRAAYRPGEQVRWKLIARQRSNGVYSTPAGQTVEFEVTDPRGASAIKGEAALNLFGSAWGSLDLTESMPLGEYRITLWEKGRRRTIGGATLFRMEEYRLPEFKVAIKTTGPEGEKTAFRLGERVQCEVQTEYYFGGAVAGASVEIVVHQNPFTHGWRPPRDFAWYYEDVDSRALNHGSGQGSGQIVKRETVKTDAAGKATFVFDTPRGSPQDLRYMIEARVIDSSRREVVSRGEVRVTRQRFYVYPRTAHNLYRPGDKVEVEVHALDANDRPVEAGGKVRVTRDHWHETWINAEGREVNGEHLEALRRGDQTMKGWRLKFRGYVHEDILTARVRTSSSGKAVVDFTPTREGFYRIAFENRVEPLSPIRGETAVWVGSGASRNLGYHAGGVQILLDRDTVRAGETTPVMLVAPASSRYVLLTVEAEDIYSHRLVRMEGTAKLIELPVRESYVPNVFLSAVMVSDATLHSDTRQMIVPPVDNFLNVDLKPDGDHYQPGEEGWYTITTRNASGQPVAAEVALAVSDQALDYIQQDYAGDPRRFYFGKKRGIQVQTQSSLFQRPYARLARSKDGGLVDDRANNVARDEEFKQEGGRHRTDATSKMTLGDSRSGVAAPSSAEADRMEAGTTSPAVQVRSDFRSTAFWQPDIVTDAGGKARVKFRYPDSLTGWTAMARVASAASEFGIASAVTRTRKPLMIRLQTPRFFVAGDNATISAQLNNGTERALRTAVSLDAEGVEIDNSGDPEHPVTVVVPANGEARVDWKVRVVKSGPTKFNAVARSGRLADAMERSLPAYEHGVEKLISTSGKLRGDEVRVRLDVPAARKRESTRLSIQLAPSLAVTMLDALPYLIDYPYGCTEQTMSRFLPAAITARTLKTLGISPDAAMARVFGGIDPRYAATTHTGGKRDMRQLDSMVESGLRRLYDFQHSDGGWGWWKQGESDHFMTAYVLWGLALAREAGIEIRSEVGNRAADFLSRELVEEENALDMQAWMLHSIASWRAGGRSAGERFERAALQNLWESRDRLNAYSRALAALSAHLTGDAERAAALARGLENGAKLDRAPQQSAVNSEGQRDPGPALAHWGEDGIRGRWSEGGVEATSFALRALLAIDPSNSLIEPATNWLIRNRRGSQWSNTRDTAITILALNDYLRATGELTASLEYELEVNGGRIAAGRFDPETAIGGPNRFLIDSELVRDGSNDIVIRKRGSGPLYFSGSVEFFSLEEPVTEAGNEIFVRRDYYRLVSRPTLLKGHVLDRVRLRDGESITSGERVEVVLTVESKNNYEYVVFEDLKPAGLEAVQLHSGSPLYAKEVKRSALAKGLIPDGGTRLIGSGGLPGGLVDYTGRTRWVHQELRDRKVALFLDRLPQGVWELRYELRAETPGAFHALPVLGHAMYVPEVRCNGSELRLAVVDRDRTAGDAVLSGGRR